MLHLVIVISAGASDDTGVAAQLLHWLRQVRGAGGVFVIGCCAHPDAVHKRVRSWFGDECGIPVLSPRDHIRLLHAMLIDTALSSLSAELVTQTKALAAQVEPLCTSRGYVLADDVALVREAWLLSAVRESQWEAGVLAPSVVRDDRMCLQLF